MSFTSDPKSNLAFWNAKFERNVARDLEHEKYWHEHGWNVIVVWECGLRKKSRAETLATILHHLETFGVSASCHLLHHYLCLWNQSHIKETATKRTFFFMALMNV